MNNNWKFLASSLYGRRFWLASDLFTFLLLIILLRYNHAGMEEVLYGSVVLLFVMNVLFLTDMIIHLIRYRSLVSSRDDILVNGNDYPRTTEQIEVTYQEMLMEAMNDKAELHGRMMQKETELKEYFSLWVHQIKTPIAAMNLLLQEKSSEQDVREEQEELFEIEQYVEMALQYMRMESETTDLLLLHTSLDKMIRQTIRKYARQFIRRKITLDYQQINEQVLTDEKWACFILEQILSNAVKYTKKGSIRIYLAGKSPCRLVVEDTGIGISQEDLPRVFEKGYTGYNGHESRYSSGIGLYLCSRASKLLGITLQIESVEGSGTKVSMLFPE